VLRWFAITLIFLSGAVLAETKQNNNCDWYCWVEYKLAALTKELEQLSKWLVCDLHKRSLCSAWKIEMLTEAQIGL
jgi:hypothetical protein